MARICRHRLSSATHAPQWLACDTCDATFTHHDGCPGRGTPGCVLRCMTPRAVRQEIAGLEALYALPAATSRDGDER